MNYYVFNYDPNYPPDYSIYVAGLRAVGRAVMSACHFIGGSYLPAVRSEEVLSDSQERLVVDFAGDLAAKQHTELIVQDWVSAEKARQVLG
jgi:hypothetical protein